MMYNYNYFMQLEANKLQLIKHPSYSSTCDTYFTIYLGPNNSLNRIKSKR